MTVDFATYCCPKDVQRLRENIDNHINSHKYDFNTKIVIHQRTKETAMPNGNCVYKYIDKYDYPSILIRNGINPINNEADDYTHGWGAAHYWKHHCVNHLVALESSDADYIVMSDSDCYMVTDGDWIKQGIRELKAHPEYLVISPSDGGKEGITQTMSQQLFLCERARLKGIDFDLPFEGFKDGGPMQEYYFMLEGRIGRYMEKNNLFRKILGPQFRYWHAQW